jgi:hypothetical protein
MIQSAQRIMLTTYIDLDRSVVLDYNDRTLRISIVHKQGLFHVGATDLFLKIKGGQPMGVPIVIGDVGCGGTFDRDDLHIDPSFVDIAISSLEHFYLGIQDIEMRKYVRSVYVALTRHRDGAIALTPFKTIAFTEVV